MKGLSKSTLPKVLMSAAILFFLIGCSLNHRGGQPTTILGSRPQPAIEQTQKETPPMIPPPKQVIVTRAEPAPPPPSAPPASPKETPPPAAPVTQVAWSSVNIREGPGLNYKVVGNVRKGASLAVLAEKGQWLRVRLANGKQVWVSKLATSLAPKPPPSSTRPKPKPM